MPYLGNIPSPIILQDVLGNYNFDYGTLYIDSVNNRVGIGTSAPSANLHVIGTANISSNLFVSNVDIINKIDAVGTESNTIAIAAFSKANNALANSTGTFSGNLSITGTVNARSGIISTANNTVGTAGQALLSTGSGTFWSTIASGTLLNIQSLTSGTTYTKTTGTNKIIAIGVGGGGTGKGLTESTSAVPGRAAGTFISYLDVSSNTTLPYVIGAAGGNTTLGTSGSFGKGVSGDFGGTSSNGTMNITGGVGYVIGGASFFGGPGVRDGGLGAYGSGGSSSIPNTNFSGTAGAMIIFEFA